MSTTNFKLGSEVFEFSETILDGKVQCDLTSRHSGISIQWSHPLYPFAIAHPRFHPLSFLRYDRTRFYEIDELSLQLACEGIGLGFKFLHAWNPEHKAVAERLIADYKGQEGLKGWNFDYIQDTYWVTAPGCLEDYLPFNSLKPILPFLGKGFEVSGTPLRVEVLADYWKEPLSEVILYPEALIPLPVHLQSLNAHERNWLRRSLEGGELTYAFNQFVWLSGESSGR